MAKRQSCKHCCYNYDLEDYEVPFTYTLQKAYFKYNKSGFLNSEFVVDSIQDLWANKLLKETNNTPHVISPLSVTERSAAKKNDSSLI